MQPALAPRIHTAAQDHVSDQILREQLLSQVNSLPIPSKQPEIMNPHSNSVSPHHHNGIDPTIAGSGVMSTSADSDGGENNGGDGRKGYGKRELSTSKRAAQNRAAQRAFRQRKEGYIKQLEEKNRDYEIFKENYKAVQAENYQLRDYIISLQSRLLESQGEFPQPPGGIDGLHPGKQQARPAPPTQLPQALPSLSAAGLDMTPINQMRAPQTQPVSENVMHGLRDSTKHMQEEAPYHQAESTPKRPRTGPEMNAAQEALQGMKNDIHHAPRVSAVGR